MTPVLLLMLAAMGTGPQPMGGSWFSDNDYPQAALVSGRGGA